MSELAKTAAEISASALERGRVFTEGVQVICEAEACLSALGLRPQREPIQLSAKNRPIQLTPHAKLKVRQFEHNGQFAQLAAVHESEEPMLLPRLQALWSKDPKNPGEIEVWLEGYTPTDVRGGYGAVYFDPADHTVAIP